MSEQFLHGIEVDDGVRPIRRVGRQESGKGWRSDHWRTLNDASIDTQAALHFAPKPCVVDSKTICRAAVIDPVTYPKFYEWSGNVSQVFEKTGGRDRD